MSKMIVTKHVQLVLSIVNHAQLANTECVIEDRSIATRTSNIRALKPAQNQYNTLHLEPIPMITMELVSLVRHNRLLVPSTAVMNASETCPSHTVVL